MKPSHLTLVVAFSLLPLSVAAAGFSDVPVSHPNYDAIQSYEGFITGYPDGTFKPGNSINRAEFVKILVAFEGREFAGNCATQSAFPDVKASDWFSAWACHAKELGYVAGYPDGTFRPANNINFVEAAKIIVNHSRLEEGPLLPQTASNPWYKQYVEVLANTNAIPISIHGFDQKITRGEMVEMIYRMKGGNMDKPSRTYDDLAGGNGSHTTAGWLPFSSSYFTLSFSIPSGFEVKEDQNYIQIAQSPHYDRAIGDSNAFLSLSRYDNYNTRDGQIAHYRKFLKNLRESKTTVDGTSFLTLKGDDYGRFEGDSAGKVVVVFFDASVLEIIERPANSDQNFDPISIGEQILSTFRFSK